MSRWGQYARQGWGPSTAYAPAPTTITGPVTEDQPPSPHRGIAEQSQMRPVYVPTQQPDRPMPPRLIAPSAHPPSYADNRSGFFSRRAGAHRPQVPPTPPPFPLRTLLAIMQEMPFSSAVEANREQSSGTIRESEVEAQDVGDGRPVQHDGQDAEWDCTLNTERATEGTGGENLDEETHTNFGAGAALEDLGEHATGTSGTELPEQPIASAQEASLSARDCEICQTAYDSDDTVLVLPCYHFFHRQVLLLTHIADLFAFAVKCKKIQSDTLQVFMRMLSRTCIMRWLSTRGSQRLPFTCPLCRQGKRVLGDKT